MKKIIFNTAFLFFTGIFFVVGQSSNLENADQEFKLKNYTQAIRLYKKELDKNNDSKNTNKILLNIGRSFKEINNYEQAIQYYKKYIDNQADTEKVVWFEYASLLLKTNNIIEAKDIFTELSQKYPGEKQFKQMAKNCDFAISEKLKKNLPLIKNQEKINSPESEFGLGFFNEQLIFASQRLDNNYSSIHGRTSQGFSDLYGADYDPDLKMYTNPKRLKGEINTQFNEGTFSYLSSSNTAYFTQCKKNPDFCRILTSKYNNKKWLKPEVVKFQSPEYNYAHPSITSDGKTMYFTTDLPGGIGGKDIWRAPILANNLIGSPENLGLNINTESDELFPFIIGDSILMFVSDGHLGMGGLDIYYSKIKDGLCEKPVNAGAPINSTADDFSILINENLIGGYFCSNRNNLEKSDDIYAFFHNIFLNDVYGKVIDSLTLAPLPVAKITYYTNNAPISIVYSDSLGNFSIPSSAHANCTNKHSLKIEKEEYRDKELIVPCNSNEEELILMTNTSTIFHKISGNIRNKNSQLPVENAKINLKSLRGIIDSTYSNSNGQYVFNKIPANDYVILRASAENYLNDSKSFKTPDIYHLTTICVSTGFETDFDLIPIELETEFEIENIYYEFDKAQLIPSSETSLNKLANLLMENPSIKIQINSHTDERGRDSYNLDLSNKRSESVVQYLIKKGIQKERLISRGFGETRLEIKNATTEEEHQKNRRTTFEIVGSIDLNIIYSDSNYDIAKEMLQKDEEAFNKFRKETNLNKQLNNTVLSQQEATKANNLSTQNINKQITDGYRIQIAALNNMVTVSKEFENISDLVERHNIYIESTGGINKYQLGDFEKREEAVEVRSLLQKRGYNDCFIVKIKK